MEIQQAPQFLEEGRNSVALYWVMADLEKNEKLAELYRCMAYAEEKQSWLP